MGAEDVLSVRQMHPDEMGFLESRDYAGKLKDIDFRPGGESDQRVNEIMKSAQTEGIREPLEVRGYENSSRPYLADGHHRLVAARRLGIKVPVKGMGPEPPPPTEDPYAAINKRREDIRKSLRSKK